jgi:uncharacterized protein YdeI (YjbR/CyaY-like superfamily)
MVRIESVDQYLAIGCMRCALGNTPECKVHQWYDELVLLRQLALEAGLREEIRWGVPTFQWEGKNVLIIAAFKDYCALNVFKGVLAADPHGLMVSPGPNSRSAKLARFTSLAEIEASAPAIRELLLEVIEVEKRGEEVPAFSSDDLELPEELVELLDSDPSLSEAFFGLTLGRQRSFAIHVGGAKQSESRARRAEKCVPKIRAGLGFHEYEKKS